MQGNSALAESLYKRAIAIYQSEQGFSNLALPNVLEKLSASFAFKRTRS